MSLWTPSGEHPVDRSREEQGSSDPQSQPQTEPTTPSLEDLPPDQRAQVEEMARQMEEARARMLKLPAGSVVGQTALQFYDLAALYLSQDPPRIEDGRIAIDAMKAVVETLGSRLGEAEQPLRQALNQIQLAFVEISNRQGDAD